MAVSGRRSDETLLVSALSDETAFAEFYARYERPVAAFFVRAVGSGELAADLTAEVFAQALSSVDRFDPRLGSSAGWLFGIARNLLARSRERGRVENTARKQLGMPVLTLDEEVIERIEAEGSGALELLKALPDDQRDALTARVVGERSYAEIAHELRCSESVARKRVSRALATLRARLKDAG
jgi:RNA polymerase sigma factor (sigma-70 family)